MSKNLFNGKVENAVRRYNSLRFFVGEDRVYPAGDILCVSTRNNDMYDLYLYADGILPFRKLYKAQTNKEIPYDSVGTEQIKNDAVKMEDLDPEVRRAIQEGVEKPDDYAENEDVDEIFGDDSE